MSLFSQLANDPLVGTRDRAVRVADDGMMLPQPPQPPPPPLPPSQPRPRPRSSSSSSSSSSQQLPVLPFPPPSSAAQWAPPSPPQIQRRRRRVRAEGEEDGQVKTYTSERTRVHRRPRCQKNPIGHGVESERCGGVPSHRPPPDKFTTRQREPLEEDATEEERNQVAEQQREDDEAFAHMNSRLRRMKLHIDQYTKVRGLLLRKPNDRTIMREFIAPIVSDDDAYRGVDGLENKGFVQRQDKMALTRRGLFNVCAPVPDFMAEELGPARMRAIYAQPWYDARHVARCMLQTLSQTHYHNPWLRVLVKPGMYVPPSRSRDDEEEEDEEDRVTTDRRVEMEVEGFVFMTEVHDQALPFFTTTEVEGDDWRINPELDQRQRRELQAINAADEVPDQKQSEAIVRRWMQPRYGGGKYDPRIMRVSGEGDEEEELAGGAPVDVDAHLHAFQEKEYYAIYMLGGNQLESIKILLAEALLKASVRKRKSKVLLFVTDAMTKTLDKLNRWKVFDDMYTTKTDADRDPERYIWNEFGFVQTNSGIRRNMHRYLEYADPQTQDWTAMPTFVTSRSFTNEAALASQAAAGGEGGGGGALPPQDGVAVWRVWMLERTRSVPDFMNMLTVERLFPLNDFRPRGVWSRRNDSPLKLTETGRAIEIDRTDSLFGRRLADGDSVHANYNISHGISSRRAGQFDTWMRTKEGYNSAFDTVRNASGALLKRRNEPTLHLEDYTYLSSAGTSHIPGTSLEEDVNLQVNPFKGTAARQKVATQRADKANARKDNARERAERAADRKEAAKAARAERAANPKPARRPRQPKDKTKTKPKDKGTPPKPSGPKPKLDAADQAVAAAAAVQKLMEQRRKKNLQQQQQQQASMSDTETDNEDDEVPGPSLFVDTPIAPDDYIGQLLFGGGGGINPGGGQQRRQFSQSQIAAAAAAAVASGNSAAASSFGRNAPADGFTQRTMSQAVVEGILKGRKLPIVDGTGVRADVQSFQLQQLPTPDPNKAPYQLTQLDNDGSSALDSRRRGPYSRVLTWPLPYDLAVAAGKRIGSFVPLRMFEAQISAKGDKRLRQRTVNEAMSSIFFRGCLSHGSRSSQAERAIELSNAIIAVTGAFTAQAGANIAYKNIDPVLYNVLHPKNQQTDAQQLGGYKHMLLLHRSANSLVGAEKAKSTIPIQTVRAWVGLDHDSFSEQNQGMLYEVNSNRAGGIVQVALETAEERRILKISNLCAAGGMAPIFVAHMRSMRRPWMLANLAAFEDNKGKSATDVARILKAYERFGEGPPIQQASGIKSFYPMPELNFSPAIPFPTTTRKQGWINDDYHAQFREFLTDDGQLDTDADADELRDRFQKWVNRYSATTPYELSDDRPLYIWQHPEKSIDTVHAILRNSLFR